jgi:hypothetical protein
MMYVSESIVYSLNPGAGKPTAAARAVYRHEKVHSFRL